LHRISTKLVVAVLATVILPFVAFAFFINEQMADRLTRNVVEQSLLGLAKDLAGQVESFVLARRDDVVQWAGAPLTNLALDDYRVERARLGREARGEAQAATVPWDAELVWLGARGEITVEAREPDHWNRSQRTREFDRVLALRQVYDLVLLVDADGRLVTASSRDRDGAVTDRAILDGLFAHDYSDESWFVAALEGEPVFVDQRETVVGPLDPRESEDRAWGHHFGVAAPVRAATTRSDEVRGVLYATVNWSYLQSIVSTPVVKDAFRGLVQPGEDPSPYAWIWGGADTVLAHPDRGLYGKSISTDLGLGQMTAAVLDDEDGWGLYPEYEFQGEEKNAAFRRIRPLFGRGESFDWTVGVGIDNRDIYATALALRRLLLGGTAVVLVVAVGWTFVIARRTTQPILELQRSTRRVAEGDLDQKIDIRTRDELGELASDFNRMTAELKEQRARIVKAEKDAAWREMARQIAHDIKNPLTPIRISLDLLERVRREDPGGSEKILERTMALMSRQVEHLRRIADDFYEFTGGRKSRPEPIDVAELLEEVLHLHDAWAVQLGVEVRRDGEEAVAFADRAKLRRVFVNLVTNALQAMPDGGELYLATRTVDGMVEVSIRDTGGGIAPEAMEHLFEPYFTTKSEGTGLGLAISQRVIEEDGGEIELVPATDEGGGTLARVRLRAHRAEGALAADGGGGDGGREDEA